eukprot:gene1246-4455_t
MRKRVYDTSLCVGTPLSKHTAAPQATACYLAASLPSSWTFEETTYQPGIIGCLRHASKHHKVTITADYALAQEIDMAATDTMVRVTETASERRFMARMAEQAGRFSDMVKIVKSLILTGQEDIPEQDRHLFATAYRNIVVPRRASWRIIVSYHADTKLRKLKDKYISSVEKELTETCWDVIDIINQVMPRLSSTESQFFFLKLKGTSMRNQVTGDHFRYLAEIDLYRGYSTDGGLDTAKVAKECYQSACDLANVQDIVNPVYLGLVLDYSVFEKEIIGNTELACGMAKKSFDAALGALDSLSDSTHQEVVSILQILRDNILLWRAEPT